jgi:hypothetical protein
VFIINKKRFKITVIATSTQGKSAAPSVGRKGRKKGVDTSKRLKNRGHAV